MKFRTPASIVTKLYKYKNYLNYFSLPNPKLSYSRYSEMRGPYCTCIAFINGKSYMMSN